MPALQYLGVCRALLERDARPVQRVCPCLAVEMSAMQAEAEQKGIEGKDGKKAGEIPGWLMAANLVFSFVFFIVLYKFIPLLLTTQLQARFPEIGGRIVFNLVDGIIRLIIFVGFLWMISRWKDIHRVFEYHGAEHRVVFNFESGKPVTDSMPITFIPSSVSFFAVPPVLIIFTPILASAFANSSTANCSLPFSFIENSLILFASSAVKT
jgi:uncharacterized protein YqhQ